MIIARHNREDLETREQPLWWHLKGLQYTSTGYGSKIPTRIQVKLPGSPRWRRVYCCIHSNIGTCYVTAGKDRKDWVVIS